MRNYLEKTLKFLEMKDNSDLVGEVLGVTSFLVFLKLPIHLWSIMFRTMDLQDT